MYSNITNVPLAVVSINNNSTLTQILLAVEMREWRGGKLKQHERVELESDVVRDTLHICPG